MTRQELVEKLNVSLTTAIEAWIGAECCETGWEEIGYVGNDLARLMAKASMAVLEGSADVQDYLEAEGHLKVSP